MRSWEWWQTDAYEWQLAVQVQNAWHEGVEDARSEEKSRKAAATPTPAEQASFEAMKGR